MTGYRQGEGESTAPAGCALHPDAAPVVFDNLLANGQAQACALWFISKRVAHLLEALENLRLIGGRNADARVDNADHQLAVALACGARDGTGVSKFDRVRDEV